MNVHTSTQFCVQYQSSYIAEFHTEFFGGGGKMMCLEQHPLAPRKVLKFTCSEVASGGFWGSKKDGN